MLIDDTVTFASSHDEKRMRNPKVIALKQRIELLGRADFEQPRQAVVEITTRDGRVLRHPTTAVRGTAANPMTRPDVDAKCFDLMAPVLGNTRARKLIDTVWNIEKVTAMRSLRPLLQT